MIAVRAGRNVGQTAWKVALLKASGGSMLCQNEQAARGIAEKWGGTVRRATRTGKPGALWFVDFQALKGGEDA